MNVYIMRHGTTVWNEKKITQGHSNNRLSKFGINLTQNVANDFKENNIDVIFSSPLMRTMQTSNIMNKFHKVKIIKDKRLIEVDKGIFTGRLRASLTKEEKDMIARRDKICGFESYESVLERVKDFSDYLKSQNYQNVLIITHSIVATMLYDLLKGNKINLSDIESLNRFNNAEIKCVCI